MASPVLETTTRLGSRAARAQRAITIVAVVTPFLGFVFAVTQSWGKGAGLVELSVLALFYAATIIGIEAGFHRYFTHRAFKTVPAVQLALGICGSMAVQGPVLFWASIHRRHHAFADRPGDPHSPNLHNGTFRERVSSFVHAHFGWLFGIEGTDWSRYVPDLLRDRQVFRINSAYGLWIALSLTLPAALGGAITLSWRGAWNCFIWGGLVRIFLVHHSTWSVNSICHLAGSREFATHDRSTNNGLLALISLGGSWHHNHHAFPSSADNGLEWWQIDICGLFIRTLERLGLAWDVRFPTKEMIAQARTPRLHPETVKEVIQA